MRSCILLLLTFSLGIFGASVVSADWSYDFDDPNWEPPASFRVGNNEAPGTPPPSETFGVAFEDGYARLSDPRGWGEGGAKTGFLEDAEVFTDVRVSATFNPSLDSNKRAAAVGARGGDHGNYSAWFWQYEDTNQGILGLTKTLADGTELWESFNPQTVDPSKAWTLVLEVVSSVDDAQMNYVDVTGMLVDPDTGETRLVHNNQDYSSPVFESGISWVGVGPADSHNADSQYPMNTTFDDISSVTIPEPSSALLIVLGLLGLAARRDHTPR
jgi:hypothetical protein